MANKIFNGLESKAYTDKAFWNKEANTIFSNSWVFVGFAHELKNVGDAIPITVADKPLLLLKNTKNKIAAFHNVCSHRCLILVDKPKNVKKIISCPYHAWAYGLDGKLLASPHFGGTNNHKPKGFSQNSHGLKSVKIKVWHDWIFININNNALEFEKYAAPLN